MRGRVVRERIVLDEGAGMCRQVGGRFGWQGEALDVELALCDLGGLPFEELERRA